MANDLERVLPWLRQLQAASGVDDVKARLAPDTTRPVRRVPGRSDLDAAAIDARWTLFPGDGTAARAALGGAAPAPETFRRNIEHFVGTVQVPVGIAGPLRVNGLHAHDDFYVPLATTEAALVASYSRGALTITEAGGCAAAVLNMGVSRAPGFAFTSGGETLSPEQPASSAETAAANAMAARRCWNAMVNPPPRIVQRGLRRGRNSTAPCAECSRDLRRTLATLRRCSLMVRAIDAASVAPATSSSPRRLP